MVATDTVVGIVGAVLLVGVMVGIYVYEFNQAEDSLTDNGDLPGPGGMAEAMAIEYDGSIAQSAGPAGGLDEHLHELNVTKLAVNLTVNVTYTSSLPEPFGPSPNLGLQLLDSEGEVLATGTTTDPSPGGAQYRISMEVVENLVPGVYQIRVFDQSTGGLSPGTDFSVEGKLVYA